MSAGFGELAAFGTASTWGVSNQIQSSVSRMIGPIGMNLIRMPYQVVFLGLMCFLMKTDIVLGGEAFWIVALSGIIGVFLCDFLLYQAIVIVGPPVGVLLLSTSTIFTAFLGWFMLGEALPMQAVAGIAVTMAGIFWVMTEHGSSTLMPGQEIPTGKRLYWGILLAVVSALAISIGMILLKIGLRAGISPLWSAFIRVAFSAVAVWIISLICGWYVALKKVRQCPKVCLMLLFSCSLGATGTWLSSLAVHLAPVGIAATLIGLQPIMVTIVGAIWYKKRPTTRIVTGMIVAFIGTALVCLR